MLGYYLRRKFRVGSNLRGGTDGTGGGFDSVKVFDNCGSDAWRNFIKLNLFCFRCGTGGSSGLEDGSLDVLAACKREVDSDSLGGLDCPSEGVGRGTCSLWRKGVSELMTLVRFVESLPSAGVPIPRPFQVMIGISAPRKYTLKS